MIRVRTYYDDEWRKHGQLTQDVFSINNCPHCDRKCPWLLIEDYTGTKVKWYRKPIIYIKYKLLDIKDYYTNPYRCTMRIVNKKFKK
jgi:hypothetical protein